ncbi:hypothetical protein CRG98_028107 [Punica granatum]|uniref:Uncharacterized protein n=1 Tax=Punica granatum TaxID=22663 RepID=A0A2I0J5P2_PUNGR|nr:hypothetical protein CRG98_028107 [Punica granatum]
MSHQTSPKALEDSMSDGTRLPLNTILHLGLDKTDPEVPGSTPRVIAYLSSVLELSIQRNERSLEASRRKKDGVTVFHSSRPPGLSIRQYLERIFKYAPCSPSCFVAAQIYIDRFTARTRSRLTSLNIHRLLITSVMVAAKFMDDVSHNNAHYAKVGGISMEEMNELEMNFLFSIDFRLHVPVDVFIKYSKQLEKEAYSATRWIKACKVGDSRPDKQVKSGPAIAGLGCRAI